jgi:hypothetical protein
MKLAANPRDAVVTMTVVAKSPAAWKHESVRRKGLIPNHHVVVTDFTHLGAIPLFGEAIDRRDYRRR